MNIFRQSIIIILIYLTGEFLSSSLHLPVPGNIIGMLLLLVLLITKKIKLEHIETVGDFLLKNLGLFFIPAGVTLITSFSSIKDSLIPIFLICFLSTIIFMVCTGKIVELVVKLTSKDKEDI